MSTDRDVTTRIVRSWLHEDAHEDADRILNLVLDEVDTTPQRSASWLARRFPPMNNYARLGLVAAAVLVAVIVGIGLFGRSTDSGPPVGAGSFAPSISSSPSPMPSPPSVLEGTWTTAEVTCDQLLATMHAAGFTDAQVTEGNWACSQPVQWRLQFLGNSFTQFGKEGDGAFVRGSGRSFELLDDQTLLLTDGQQTLNFTLVGDVLTFSSVSGSPGDIDGQVHAAAIFLTAPFTKEP